jgi:CubicO group peptidase (beta-lactamase class C family)
MMLARARVIVLLVAAAAGTLSAQPASIPGSSSSLAAAVSDVDAHASGDYARDPVGSLMVGVVADGGLAWSKAYGYADVEARRTPTDQTPYRIGSITKQFVGLTLLQLAERGKVRLSDPLVKHVPEFAAVKSPYPDAPPITLIQLATMTSGLAREPSGGFDHSQGSSANWEQIVLGVLPRVTYAHEPGTRYLYCNIGYALLGLALGRAAGQPFTAYVAQQILQPLGMTNSGFEVTPAMRPLLARGYDVSKEGRVDWSAPDREWNGRGYRVPNGGLISTMSDLAKFVAWELGAGPDTVLARDTQKENYLRLMVASGDLANGYGVGFRVERRGTLAAHGHGGSTSGFLSQALFDRESKTGVIVFRSVTGGKLNPADVAMRALQIVSASRKRPTN